MIPILPFLGRRNLHYVNITAFGEGRHTHDQKVHSISEGKTFISRQGRKVFGI
jgi:hypothetical protein